MKKIDFRKPTPPHKGQSLVELALTITIVLILLAGAFDLGNAFLDYIALRDAAQEGAVYGSIYRSIPSDSTSVNPIVSRVKESSTAPINFSVNFIEDCSVSSPNGICVTFSGSGLNCSGDEITVTVRYHYQITMPFIGGIIGSQFIPLHASVTNVILTFRCE